MELANNGDLYQKIIQHKNAGTYFEEDDIWKIYIQIIRGLRSLHKLNILHRDLKVIIYKIIECQCLPIC